MYEKIREMYQNIKRMTQIAKLNNKSNIKHIIDLYQNIENNSEITLNTKKTNKQITIRKLDSNKLTTDGFNPDEYTINSSLLLAIPTPNKKDIIAHFKYYENKDVDDPSYGSGMSHIISNGSVNFSLDNEELNIIDIKDYNKELFDSIIEIINTLHIYSADKIKKEEVKNKIKSL